jgi:amidase
MRRGFGERSAFRFELGEEKFSLFPDLSFCSYVGRMRKTPIFSLCWISPSLLLALLICGCDSPQRWPKGSSRDHAFISHFPSPEGSTKLKLALKDNIDMEGVVTTVGSEYFAKTRQPAEQDADCLAIARRRGVEIVGKTNLSEFAVYPSGINDYYGTPRSPLSRWKKLIPGGSSSGCAYVVATGKADVAFGTDTAGSVRVPAACCGVVGLKTTFGLVSLKGLHPVEPEHLDTVGPIARDIAGVAMGMDLLEDGFAARYAAAVVATPSAQAIKIGRLNLRGTDQRIDRAVDEALERAGFQVIPLGDSFRAKWEQAQRDGNTLAASGAYKSNRAYVRKLGVTARTKSVLTVGAVALSTQYQAALGRRSEWKRTLERVLESVDFIAVPTMQILPAPVPPSLKFDILKARFGFSNLINTSLFTLNNPRKILSYVPTASLRLIGVDLLEADLANLQNTAAVNFAGNPALALPIPLEDGPVSVTSLQLIGPRFSESKLLATGLLLGEKTQQKVGN